MKTWAIFLSSALSVLAYQAKAEITAKYEFKVSIAYNFAMKANGGALLLKGTTADYDVNWSGKVFRDGIEMPNLTIEADGVTLDQPASHVVFLIEPGGQKTWAHIYKSEEGAQKYIISDEEIHWSPESGELENMQVSEGEADEFQMINLQAFTALSNTQVQNTLNKMFGTKDLNTTWIVSFNEKPRARKFECSGIRPLAHCTYEYAFVMSAKQKPGVEISDEAIEAAQKPKSAREFQEDEERKGST